MFTLKICIRHLTYIHKIYAIVLPHNEPHVFEKKHRGVSNGWPNHCEATWGYSSGLKLAQVRECCLRTPSHYWTNADLSKESWWQFHRKFVRCICIYIYIFLNGLKIFYSRIYNGSTVNNHTIRIFPQLYRNLGEDMSLLINCFLVDTPTWDQL